MDLSDTNYRAERKKKLTSTHEVKSGVAERRNAREGVAIVMKYEYKKEGG